MDMLIFLHVYIAKLIFDINQFQKQIVFAQPILTYFVIITLVFGFRRYFHIGNSFNYLTYRD